MSLAAAHGIDDETPEGDEGEMLAKLLKGLGNSAMGGDGAAGEKEMMDLLQQMSGLAMDAGGMGSGLGGGVGGGAGGSAGDGRTVTIKSLM